MSTLGDIMSTSGDIMSTSGDVQYLRGIPWCMGGNVLSTMRATQYIGGLPWCMWGILWFMWEYIMSTSGDVQVLNKVKGFYQFSPPHESWCTHGIPPMYWTPPPPPQCTEHIIRGESIQILIVKPNAHEQVILSTLTFVTVLLQACLFWKRTVVEFNPPIDFYPY